MTLWRGWGIQMGNSRFVAFVHAMFMQFPVVIALPSIVWMQVPAAGRVFGFMFPAALSAANGGYR